MRRFVLPILAVAATLMLAACGSSYQEKAYTLGQSYELSQQAAIGYMEVAKPSSDVTGKIKDANDKAAPMVKEVLQCARDMLAAEETGAVPAEAAALGLDADAALEAKEEACEGLLSKALLVIDALDGAVSGS
jgi:hypothetical protein